MFDAKVIRLVIQCGLNRLCPDFQGRGLNTGLGSGLISFFEVNDNVALDVFGILVGWSASFDGMAVQRPTVEVEVLVFNKSYEPFPAFDKLILEFFGILLVTQRINRKGTNILFTVVVADAEGDANQPTNQLQSVIM